MSAKCSSGRLTVAPALLSIADGARYLGVSTRTIEAYVAAGLVVPCGCRRRGVAAASAACCWSAPSSTVWLRKLEAS